MIRPRVVQYAWLVLGVGGAAYALWATIGSAGEAPLPALARWPVAFGFSSLSVVAASKAWVTLFEALGSHRQLARALYVSQLGKYLPGGGIFQAVGAVGMSRGTEVSTARAAMAVPVTALATAAACAVIGTGLAFSESRVEGRAAWFFLLGFLAPAGLYRPVSVVCVQLLRRVTSRVPHPDDLPSQRSMLHSAAWTFVSVSCTCGSFAVLAAPLVDSAVASLVSAFAVAWLAGFLIVPLPGGVGVREAALVGILSASATGLLAAAIAHRIVTILAEVSAVSVHIAHSGAGGRSQTDG